MTLLQRITLTKLLLAGYTHGAYMMDMYRRRYGIPSIYD